MQTLSTKTKSPKKVITRNVLILANEDDGELNFEEIFALTDINAATQAFKMAQFFQDAIKVEGTDEIYFDMNEAITLVKESKEYAIVEYVDQTLTQTDNTVSVMVEQVLGLLDALLDIALGEKQQEQLAAGIKNVFTNLAPQEEDAWIFWSKSEAHKCAYQYNILFAVQNAETGFFLYGLPMGMTISADVSKESVLFITLEDKCTYSVHVQAMKVVTFLETELQRRAMALLQGESN